MNELLTRRELLLMLSIGAAGACRRDGGTAVTDVGRKETDSATVTLVVDGMI